MGIYRISLDIYRSSVWTNYLTVWLKRPPAAESFGNFGDLLWALAYEMLTFPGGDAGRFH